MSAALRSGASFFGDSVRDLEQEILSDGGYFNAFTTYTCGMVDGQLQRFECFYRDEHGSEHWFDKENQLEREGFGEEYRDRRLRWLQRDITATPPGGT